MRETSPDRLRQALDAWWAQSERADVAAHPGVDANRRLTGLAGAALAVLLPLVVLSGLVFGWSPGLHFFLGFLALPLTLLKMATTGWRFLSYYLLRSPPYRSAGPPSPLPRLLGPVVVAATVAVFVTGVVLFFQGRDHGTVASLHTDIAVIFSLAVLLHVAVHLRSAAEVTLADAGWGGVAAAAVRGVGSRRALVLGALVAGVVVAAALVGGYHWTLLRHLERG